MTVGLLGGRFDPPHLGHRALAEAAVEQLALDELHVRVVADAAHKESVAPAEERLALARIAFAGVADSVELEHHAYTVDALEAGDWDDPFFLIGADELEALPTWKEPGRLLELARLGVAARPGYPPAVEGPRITAFELAPHPVSSTEIRQRLASGEPVDGLLAPEVAAAIRARGLYVRGSGVH